MYKSFIKRILDFIVAIVLLVLFWWLLAIIAVAIFLTDGTPIVFTQERIGLSGKPFRIYKFRTMVKNAEAIGTRSTSANDPRITPIGRFLRKSSMDELVQLFNIIKGEMSFVGFRPGVRENYTEEDFNSGIFAVRPGITGYAQVNGRSGLTIDAKRKLELSYVKDISFVTDLKILFKTVAVVLKRSNSN